MSAEILTLDDPLCRQASVAGGKAAGLAAARSAGLPVLDGFVVTAQSAAPSLRAGAQALADRGSGGARSVTMATQLGDGLSNDLFRVVLELGGDVVVRSSATVEASGEWSGAFSTFADIGVGEVATAVRGCWASVFTVDAIERGEQAGVPPGSVAMAVLVQPRIKPQVAGLGRINGTTVEIDAVVGSPAALMEGWAEGQRISVDLAGDVSAPDDALLDVVTARDVASLARRAECVLGHNVIEWALADHQLVLLQTLAVAQATPPQPPVGLPGLSHPNADRVAQLALSFPGQLCDELVLSWALAVRDPSSLAAPRPASTGGISLADCRREAGNLAASVWGLPSEHALNQSRSLLRSLRSREPALALEMLDRLAEPDLETARVLLASLLNAGDVAVTARLLHRAEDMFGCSTADLHPTAKGEPRQSWKGARGWEPFLVGVAQTRGTAAYGQPASSGVGAGRARVIKDPHRPPSGRRPRDVIVTTSPIPALSSLLWDAAGLVTTGGSAAAHLIEVARSLKVPTVVACSGLPPLDSLDGQLLAVDGDLGCVSRLQFGD